MWTKIRELTPEGRERWLKNIGSPRGEAVLFRGVLVLDVDLVEALKNAK
jgi:hypothetical protein